MRRAGSVVGTVLFLLLAPGTVAGRVARSPRAREEIYMPFIHVKSLPFEAAFEAGTIVEGWSGDFAKGTGTALKDVTATWEFQAHSGMVFDEGEIVRW
jgi:hypothetical protein